MEISYEKLLSAVTLLVQGLTRCVAATVCRRHNVWPPQCVTPQPGHCLAGDSEGKKLDLIVLEYCEVLCSMMKRDGCERLMLVLFCGGYTQVHGGTEESNSSLKPPRLLQ